MALTITRVSDLHLACVIKGCGKSSSAKGMSYKDGNPGTDI